MDVESIRSEVAFRFSRSSGPGGQHAQKSSTRVEALFDVEASAGLTRRRAPSRARRSSARSCARSPRTSARSCATASLRRTASSSSCARRRRSGGGAARPSRRQASRERRLDEKKRRGQTKRLRRSTDE